MKSYNIFGRNRVALEKAATITALSCLSFVIATAGIGVVMNVNPGFSGHKHSLTSKHKMSLAQTGRTHSTITKYKISIGNKGKPKSEAHRIKLSIANIGKHLSDITRYKMSLAGRGRPKSDEHKRKLSEALYQYYETHVPWPLGKRASASTREKDVLARKKYWETHPHLTAEKNPAWQGGICNLPYPFEWKKIKGIIKQRDKYECQLLSCEGLDRQLHVHHIDYDKNNCHLNNLITLCRTCHCKTSWHRKQYQKMFTKLMTIKQKESV